MSLLDHRLHLAMRRMRLQHFLHLLWIGTLASAPMAALPFVLLRLGLLPAGRHLAELPTLAGRAPLPLWWAGCVMALLGTVTLIALWRAFRTSVTPVKAALLLDRHYGTRECLTSAILTGESLLSAPLKAEAERRAPHLDFKKAIPLVRSTLGHWAGGALILLLALPFLLPSMPIFTPPPPVTTASSLDPAGRERVLALAEALQAHAQALRSRREGLDPTELTRLAERLEALAAKLEKEREIDPALAKAMLTRLQGELEQEALAAAERARPFQELRPLGRRRLLRRFNQALRSGDLKTAREEFGSLRDKLTEPQGLERLQREVAELGAEASKLQAPLQALDKALQGMEGRRNRDKLAALEKKLREGQKDRGAPPDLSNLTDEERDLLAKLQQALGQMELTDQLLAAMEKEMQAEQLRSLTREDLARMLEAMKQDKAPCPGCRQPGWDGLDRSRLAPQTNEAEVEEETTPPTSRCPVCGREPPPPHGPQPSGMMLIPSGSERSSTPSPSGSSGGAQRGEGQEGENGSGLGEGKGGGPAPQASDPDETGIEDRRLRARALAPGETIATQYVRGLPPKGAEARAEYVEAVDRTMQDETAVREQERIPREAREMIRRYHTLLRGEEK